MRRFLKPINNQNGSLILVALLLLVILTIMGITSTSTSVIENRIAVNEQLHKMAFYHADSGLYATAKLIGATIDEGDVIEEDANLAFAYSPRYEDDTLDLDFYDQITGLEDYDDGSWDVRFDLENGVVRADIRFMGTSSSGEPEGGVVFGEDATAPAGAQELSLYFRIVSLGTEDFRNSRSTLSAGYRKVLDVPGGL